MLLYLFACFLVDDELAYRYPATIAGVRAVPIVVWCCLEGIAGWRYPLGVHSYTSFLWAGPRGIRRQTSRRGRFAFTQPS